LQCAGTLEAEALVAGKLLRLPKHSHVMEFYGSVEEAEALLARARISLSSRDPQLAQRLETLQRMVRLLPAALAGAVDAGKLLRHVKAAVDGLPRPEGWSLTGCTPEDPDIMLAAAKLRAAERQLSRAAEDGLVPGSLAQQLSAVIGELAYALYTVHWVLCEGRGAKTILELAAARP
jgi:cob(I)alamin adenosyltransferase